jgi:cyclase
MRRIFGISAAMILTTASALAAEAPNPPDPGSVQQVTENIFVATIENRNTPILVGDNRIMIVETNFERNAETLAGLIHSISPAPVDLVWTSHWHGDHNGGNAYFREHGAILMSHENTRTRLMHQQINPVSNGVQLEAQPPEMLPDVTIKDGATIYWGDEVVEIVYYPDGHTDSDLVFYYKNANVIYVGGLIEYPQYAGVNDAQKFIDAINAVVDRTNAETKIIPWQGPVIPREEFLRWRDIIVTMRERVSAMIAQGMTEEQVVAAHPSAEFDAEWGTGRTPNRFAQDMYYALTHPIEH